MPVKLTQHQNGEMLTITADATAMGKPITATLSGSLAYAMIDGLLWWTLNRKLDALVAKCMHMIDHSNMEHAGALHVGEALVMYVHTTPWQETTEERAARVVSTIYNRLPELAPLADAIPAAGLEHADLVKLAEILKSRLAHVGDAGHGLENILVMAPQKQAAA